MGAAMPLSCMCLLFTKLPPQRTLVCREPSPQAHAVIIAWGQSGRWICLCGKRLSTWGPAMTQDTSLTTPTASHTVSERRRTWSCRLSPCELKFRHNVDHVHAIPQPCAVAGQIRGATWTTTSLRGPTSLTAETHQHCAHSLTCGNYCWLSQC
jgi:hypothetical protein